MGHFSKENRKVRGERKEGEREGKREGMKEV